MDYEQVLKEVVWRVTEGSVSYRRIKRSFDLNDDALEDVRRVLIGALHIATDLDGEHSGRPMGVHHLAFGRARTAVH